MTRKKRRLYFVALGMLALGGATALVLTALEDTMVYFYSPSDVVAQHVQPDRRFRLGGLVEAGSVSRLPDGVTVRFVVTDTQASVPIHYKGVLPDLFREGQGIVAEGRLGRDGVFQASEVLAKHDETYMPKEVADALRKSGQWRDGSQAEPKP